MRVHNIGDLQGVAGDQIGSVLAKFINVWAMDLSQGR